MTSRSPYPPMVYGINVPSGRLVIGQDLRTLIYHDTFYGDTLHEDTKRPYLTHCADLGLLCLESMPGDLMITRTPTKDAYTIGRGPAPSPNTLATIRNHQSCVYMMDGDHVDAALRCMHPTDADTIRAGMRIVGVTPGYYTLTMESTIILLTYGKIDPFVSLARTDAEANHPTIVPHTYTMAEAINTLTTYPHTDTPFYVWNRHQNWALGCPTPQRTNGLGNTPGTYTPVSSLDITPLTGLISRNLGPFYPWAAWPQDNVTNYMHFAPIPHYIAPEAIACWMAGADASIEGVRHILQDHTVSQHTMLDLHRRYQDFRDRLWGAAHTHHCTDTVLHHLDTLRGLIAAP